MVFDIMRKFGEYLMEANDAFDTLIVYDADKDQLQGIDDALRNHIFIRYVANVNGNDFPIAEGDYDGCGSYRITVPVEAYIVLEKCFDKNIVLKLILAQVAKYEEMTLTSAGFNSGNIYRDLYDLELGNNMIIIKLLGTLTGVSTGANCESICQDTCCT